MMASVEKFEDLRVWQNARRLANMIYDFSSVGEFARDFGLRDQMRRAAVSVMSNIAEGFESRTQAMFIEYLGRAKASAGELRAQLYLAVDRNYITEAQVQQAYELVQICSGQLVKLSRYLESQPNSRRISEDGELYNV
jgi:four helix bundle protein